MHDHRTLSSPRVPPVNSVATARQRGIRTALAALVLALIAAGCGGIRSDYSKVTLIDAGGTITLDGRPLAGATVVFRDPGGSFSSGVTDADGRYRLQFDSVKAGVTPGPKTVLVTSRPVGEEAGTEADDAAEAETDDEAGEAAGRPAASEQIPARYNRRSTLAVEVTSDTRTFDFDLTSD